MFLALEQILNISRFEHLRENSANLLFKNYYSFYYNVNTCRDTNFFSCIFYYFFSQTISPQNSDEAAAN